MYIKLKYIRISLNIYQHKKIKKKKKKKEENNINYENIPNAYQVAVSNLHQSVIFKPKLPKLYSDTQAVICQWQLHNYT